MTGLVVVLLVLLFSIGPWVAGAALAVSAGRAGNPQGALIAILASTAACLAVAAMVAAILAVPTLGRSVGPFAAEPIPFWAAALLVLRPAALLVLLVATPIVWLLVILTLKGKIGTRSLQSP